MDEETIRGSPGRGRIGLAAAMIAGGVAVWAISAPHPSKPARAAAPQQQYAAAPSKPRALPPRAAASLIPAAPAVDAPYVIRRILPITGPIRIGDYAWDETGAPPGEILITADLDAGTLSVFRAGYEIGTAAILYGVDDKITPLGVFPILAKDARHVSSLYGASMPYTLRLTGDGVSIHGAEMVPGYATHGCIGVPIAFAKRLFAVVKTGDRVIVTQGRTAKLGDAIARR